MLVLLAKLGIPQLMLLVYLVLLGLILQLIIQMILELRLLLLSLAHMVLMKLGMLAVCFSYLIMTC